MLPWPGILFAGSVALGGWFLIGPSLGSAPYYKVGWHRTAYEYSDQVILLCIPWALALFAWRRGARAPVWLLFGGAVLLHLLVLFAPLPQSQDFYQYLFYGRMQAVHGANPFVVNPSTFWADRWFPWIRWNSQRSVYGPAWILLSYSVVKVAGNHLAVAFATLKVAILAMDLGIMSAIVSLSRDRDDPEGAAGWGLLAYAWSPLVLIAVPLAGSADVAVAAGFVGALLARRRGRDGVATLLLALAALVKVYAVIGIVLHLIVVMRQRGVRRAIAHAAFAAALGAAFYAPYWAGVSTFRGLIEASGITNQSLAGTVQRTVVTSVLHALGVHYWYTGAAVAVRIAGLVALAAVAIWIIRRCRDERSLWWGVLVLLTAYLMLTPWFLYWYMLAPLALVAALPQNRLTYPLLTFAATALITVYLPWPPTLWIVQTILRYVPPIAVFALQRSDDVVDLPSRTVQTVLELPTPLGAVLPRATPAAK